jgi:hypothetical protein
LACCGETRTGRLTISQKDIDEGLTLQIEYAGGRTVRIRGAVTGSEYVFSGLERIRAVDPRDAPHILSNGSFRLKGLAPQAGPRL